MKSRVAIYTDGACLNNPGRGGWGVIFILEGGRELTYSGAEKQTTNNRMELTAVIQALKHSELLENAEITIYSDSKYVITGITEWIHGWKKNGWINSQRKAVLNADLWRELDLLRSGYKDIKWQWVKAHNGQRENEIVDNLARIAAERV